MIPEENDSIKKEKTGTGRKIASALKNAFFRNKYYSFRTLMCILSVASLFVPVLSVHISFTWWEYDISVGAAGFVKILGDSFWSLFNDLTDIGILNPVVINVFVSYIIYLFTALAVLICTVIFILSPFWVRKCARFLAYAGGFLLVLSAVNTVITAMIMSAAADYSTISVTPLFGSLISMGAFGLFTFSDMMVIRQMQNEKGRM